MHKPVNTNSSECELSGLVAEAHGQAVPLGFILTGNVNGTAKPGAKMRVLTDFLTYFKDKLPKLKFTLTDKEISEIDAFAAVWPDAKHQICIWHAVRTVEGRLAENNPTALYNALLAHKRFSFINPSWSPKHFKSSRDAALEMENGGVQPRVIDEKPQDLQQDLLVSAQSMQYNFP